MLAISLTIACSRYTYNGVMLYAHPVRGESHNQRNATREVVTIATNTTASNCNISSHVVGRNRQLFYLRRQNYNAFRHVRGEIF